MEPEDTEDTEQAVVEAGAASVVPSAAYEGTEVPPAMPTATDAIAAADAPAAVVETRTARRKRRRTRLLIEWGVVLAVAAALALTLRAYVVQAFFVPSTSMVPTLDVGDRILVIKQGWLSGPIGRGSVIVFRHPPNIPCAVESGVTDLVKRVIGLPGDTISSGGPGGNTVYIDGKPLAEAGWFAPDGPEVGPKPITRTTIPPGDYFVMGDNRASSCDSRYFGPIAASSIVGKVVLLVWRNGHPYFKMF